METLVRDLRHAIRDLIANPGFTLVVVLTLALGIGANVVIFSVVNGVLLRTLPYEHPERLVAVWEVDARTTPVEYRNPVSAGNFGDWREQRGVFDHVAAFTWFDSVFSGVDGPERISLGRVSAGFFETLVVQPSLGRVFLPEEDQPARRQVTVLSHAFWHARLGSDPNVIGRVVRVGDVDYTVVGVLPAGSDLLSLGVEAWTPMGLPASDFQNRRSHGMRVFGRLKPGVTIERAQARMTVVADVATLEEVVAKTRADRQFVMLLLGLFAALALGLAAVGIYGVVSYSVGQRTQEIGIRMALGARPASVLRLVIAQSMRPVWVGIGLGAACALALSRVMTSLLFGVTASDPMTFVGVSIVLAGVALFACYLPARRAMAIDVTDTLRAE